MLFGQQIDEFAFGFVAPLQTDNASTRQVKNLKKAARTCILNTRMYAAAQAVVKGVP